MKSSNVLSINLLGPLEIRRGKRVMELPSSRKARGLLAYLIANQRPHRRDRLTSLLWDVADDPKGGLRWCLTKIRPLVDEPQRSRILSDRDTVEFRAEDAQVDIFLVRDALRERTSAQPLGKLQQMATLFRGTFLEGLELPDYDAFQAWLIAERQNALQQYVSILNTILDLLANDPEQALPYARVLFERDPFNERAKSRLLDLLVRLGRHAEARQLSDLGKRMADELGPVSALPLVQSERDRAGQMGEKARTAWIEPDLPKRPDGEQSPMMVGREGIFARFRDAVRRTRDARRGSIILLTGEPGVGKSLLLSALSDDVMKGRGTVLLGRSYEAEARRPYGPWIDAIRSIHPTVVGEDLRNRLAPLLTGLVEEDIQRSGKDRLFAAIVELLAARAHSAPPVLLQFDDIQWCDEASAELLHYVVRMTRHHPVSVLLAARSGELPDNEPVMRALRGFRRDRWIEEFKLEPLSRDDIVRLVRNVSPELDAHAVFEETGGNPLYAIELARASANSGQIANSTLAGIIRDRVDRLPGLASDILRWVAVLGSQFTLRRLEGLVSAEFDEVTKALEILDRHQLLRSQSHGGPAPEFDFTHSVVRRSVYDDISEPRRRLMHRRVAQVFEKEENPAMAAEVTHHAALAGETATAARTSVAAGRYCLRIYANGEALAFARSGMRYSEGLPESQRVGLQVDLMEVSLSACRPKDVEEIAAQLEDLAERALSLGDIEHARLGFHLLSYLRWEIGEWSDARRHTLRAEQIARGADAKEQVVAMAEAARCLALLERDLAEAEALALEARARASNEGVEIVAIPDALGMLRFHQGAWDDAANYFHTARQLAVRSRDRIGEFRALEHLIVLELERARADTAKTLCRELTALAARLREGSEVPFARCLAALSAEAVGDRVAGEIDQALESLRMADAKHRLAYSLLRATNGDFERGDIEKAQSRAAEALRLAEVLGRPSETAMAHVILYRCASHQGDRKGIETHRAALHRNGLAHIAAYVREAVEKYVPAPKGATSGTRAR